MKITSKLYKHVVQTMLKAEMDEYLGYKKHEPAGKNFGINRSSTNAKTLKTDIGDIPPDIPRDLNTSFDPVIVHKHQWVPTKIEQSIFPAAITQLCIVQQIRNFCKYVVWKERKAFVADLRLIYEAPDK